MSVAMGRGLGLLIMLFAFTACGRSGNKNEGSGSSGTDDSNTSSTTGNTLGGQGGTNPQGQGGTNPHGQGGTNPQGQGGTMPMSMGGFSTQGAGGAMGGTGGTGTGGDGGFAGVPDGGAAGETATCGDECDPCDEGYVYTECDSLCVCEPTDSPDKPVYGDLVACDLDDPCPRSVRTNYSPTITWTDGLCMLTAFRDRTPGIYHHASVLSQDSGEYITDVTFLLGGDDQVLMLRTTTNALAPGNAVREYLPTWSCTLSSYEVLDACIAAGTEAQPGQTICDGTEDWFDTCETAVDPVCPGG